MKTVISYSLVSFFENFEKKISSYFLADTAGYVSLWYIGDYACKQPDSKEKQMKFAEEKTRILAKFSSHLRSTITGIFYRKIKDDDVL
jgi:hypothetical protein